MFLLCASMCNSCNTPAFRKAQKVMHVPMATWIAKIIKLLKAFAQCLGINNHFYFLELVDKALFCMNNRPL